MTLSELGQICPLRAEIEMDAHRIEELECELKTTPWPKAIQEIIDIISAKKKRCEVQLEELERWLADIEDPYIREVISLRCVDGLSWKAAAQRMGGGNTSSNLRAAANRYLRRVGA